MGERKAGKSGGKNGNGATLRFEKTLWQAARQARQQHGRGGVQTHRPSPDLFEIHLRLVQRTTRQALGGGRRGGVDPLDPDEYRAYGVL
jgi:hypothetical protein